MIPFLRFNPAESVERKRMLGAIFSVSEKRILFIVFSMSAFFDAAGVI